MSGGEWGHVSSPITHSSLGCDVCSLHEVLLSQWDPGVSCWQRLGRIAHRVQMPPSCNILIVFTAKFFFTPGLHLSLQFCLLAPCSVWGRWQTVLNLSVGESF